MAEKTIEQQCDDFLKKHNILPKDKSLKNLDSDIKKNLTTHCGKIIISCENLDEKLEGICKKLEPFLDIQEKLKKKQSKDLAVINTVELLNKTIKEVKEPLYRLDDVLEEETSKLQRDITSYVTNGKLPLISKYSAHNEAGSFSSSCKSDKTALDFAVQSLTPQYLRTLVKLDKAYE